MLRKILDTILFLGLTLMPDYYRFFFAFFVDFSSFLANYKFRCPPSKLKDRITLDKKCILTARCFLTTFKDVFYRRAVEPISKMKYCNHKEIRYI